MTTTHSAATPNLERRTYHNTPAPELRAQANGRTISGSAVVFGELSQNLGGFVERFMPGAFDRTLQTADVLCLVNHDRSQILGRSSAGNVTYTADDVALRYKVTPPATSVGNDAVENVRAGLVVGSSIGFRCIRDEWSETESGYPLRSVFEAELYDGGPVVAPAYLQTGEGANALAVRSYCEANGLGDDVVDQALAVPPANLRDLVVIVSTGDGDDDDDTDECDDDEVEDLDDPAELGTPDACAEAEPEQRALKLARARLDLRERALRLGQ